MLSSLDKLKELNIRLKRQLIDKTKLLSKPVITENSKIEINQISKQIPTEKEDPIHYFDDTTEEYISKDETKQSYIQRLFKKNEKPTDIFEEEKVKAKEEELKEQETKIKPKDIRLTKPNTPINIISLDDNKIRKNNIIRVKKLYRKLKIFEKSPNFDTIFIYKAMNLSGISLKEDDFGDSRRGKYIQVIAITYEPDINGKKKAKNISLGYFGKAETMDITLKSNIIEFVLRWRYEKAFQNVEHYKNLIARIDILD